MPVTREEREIEVTELYVATFNRAPESDGLDYWVDSDWTINMIADSFFNQSESQALYTDIKGDPLSSHDFVVAIYSNLFNRLPEMAGLEYWMNALDSNTVSQSEMILVVVNAAQGDDKLILNNKTVAGLYYAESDLTAGDYSLADVDSTPESLEAATTEIDTLEAQMSQTTDLNLTSDTDRLTGTAGDDFFDAPIAQNPWAGGVSNTLSTADRLDGGAGVDTLHAELVPEFFGVTGDNQMDVQPRIKGIEDIQFEAMDVSSSDNANLGTITVDAKNIKDVVKIGSSFSDGDLVIENLTTLTSADAIRNTEAITITMDHTDNFDSDHDASDLTVLFDEDYLVRDVIPETNIVQYEVMNQDAWDLINVDGQTDVELLDGVTFVRFNFTLNGKDYDLVDLGYFAVENTDPTGTAIRTHQDLADVVNAALVDLKLDGLINVTIGTFDERDGLGNVTGVRNNVPAVVLTAVAGATLEADENFVFLDSASDATIPTSNRYDRADDDIVVGGLDPITVNVELEKVGRDGEGGNLKIGGKDLDLNGNSDVDKDDGIEVFNITVKGDEDKPSNLGQIVSTNDALHVVNIASEVNTAADATYAALTVRGGSTFAGWAANPFGATLTTLDADAFLGDLNIGQQSAAVNVDTFTAMGGGDVIYNANITGVPTPTGNVTGKGVWTNTTGVGDDKLTFDLDGDAVDTDGTSFSVSSGSGDDTVTVNMVEEAGENGVSQTTMATLENLTISTGANADIVNLNAYGNFNIDAGAGDDFVRINSMDDNGVATAGTWTFGDTSSSTTGNSFADGGARVLYQAKLTVSFAGFESTVNVATTADGDFLATQVEINAAIKNAIESDTNGLAKLLSVTNGTYEELTVTALIGGDNKLAIDLFQPQLVEDTPGTGEVKLSSSADEAALVDGLVTTGAIVLVDTNDVTTADVVSDVNTLGVGSLEQDGGEATGEIDYNVAADDHFASADADVNAYQDYIGVAANDATEVNFSTVKAGIGEDVVVFHSNIASSNTLDLNDSFGEVKVVNFHNVDAVAVDDAGQVGVHALDFAKLLTDETSASGSTESEVTVDITLNIPVPVLANDDADFTDADARSNSVNLLQFDEDVHEDSISFDDITLSNLVAQLNDDAADANEFGGLNGTDLTAVDAPANFVGTTQNHIIMIENSQNPGEYKVFHVKSTVDAAGDIQNDGDFTGQAILGTVDFGASINFSLAGNSDYEAFKSAYISYVDNAVVDQTFQQFVDAEGLVVDAEYTDKVGATVANPSTVTPGLPEVTVVTTGAAFDSATGFNTSVAATATADNNILIVEAAHTAFSTLNGVGGTNTATLVEATDYDLTDLISIANIATIDALDATSLTVNDIQLDGVTSIANAAAADVTVQAIQSDVDLSIVTAANLAATVTADTVLTALADLNGAAVDLNGGDLTGTDAQIGALTITDTTANDVTVTAIAADVDLSNIDLDAGGVINATVTADTVLDAAADLNGAAVTVANGVTLTSAVGILTDLAITGDTANVTVNDYTDTDDDAVDGIDVAGVVTINLKDGGETIEASSVVAGAGTLNMVTGAGVDTFTLDAEANAVLSNASSETDLIHTFTSGTGSVVFSTADIGASAVGDWVEVAVSDGSNTNGATFVATGTAFTFIYDTNDGNLILDVDGDTAFTDDGSGYANDADDIVLAGVFSDAGVTYATGTIVSTDIGFIA